MYIYREGLFLNLKQRLQPDVTEYRVYLSQSNTLLPVNAYCIEVVGNNYCTTLRDININAVDIINFPLNAVITVLAKANKELAYTTINNVAPLDYRFIVNSESVDTIISWEPHADELNKQIIGYRIRLQDKHNNIYPYAQVTKLVVYKEIDLRTIFSIDYNKQYTLTIKSFDKRYLEKTIYEEANIQFIDFL